MTGPAPVPTTTRVLLAHPGTNAADVSRKVWTAEELEKMTPAEQDSIFASSIVTDFADIPEQFLDRVKNRVQDRIAKTESPNP